MKNLKFNSFFTFLVIFTSLLIFSCSHEEENLKENKKSLEITNNTKLLSTTCDIIGPLNVSTGTYTYTYTYTNDSNNTNVNWTITPSSAAVIQSGQGTSTITITFNSSCTLSAYGTGGTGGACEDIISITQSGGNNGGDCACPNPVIRCVLAVSGGHPYWRLQLDNLQAGDTYTWSQLHAPFMAGTNNTYVIVNPTGPIYSGFTVYCEVKRVCPNGTIKKRKAFYTNYYGGTTTTGTQGFINLGGVCDSNIGGGLE